MRGDEKEGEESKRCKQMQKNEQPGGILGPIRCSTRPLAARTRE